MDALKLSLDGAGEGADGEGFCEPWDAFEEDVAVAKEADEEAVDEVALTDDDAANFLTKERDPGGSFLYFVVNFRDILSYHNA